MRPRVIIQTPARLHLGIINPFNPKYRLYMSLGVAIDYPNNIVSIYYNKPLMIEGCRSREVYDKINALIEEYDLKTGHVIIEKCIPKHVGLGSTTQLLLAIAHGLLLVNNVDEDIVTVAKKLGLGSVSGVGTYVYKYGGFIVDSGKKDLHEFPRLLFRYDFPSKWRFIIITPQGRGLDEKQEEALFRELREDHEDLVEKASSILITRLIPSIVQEDFSEFSAALRDLQETIGTMFSQYQGGVYSAKSIIAIEALKKLGIIGVGQSSWGPTVYGLVENDQVAKRYIEELKHITHVDVDIFVARPWNRGASVKIVL